MKKMKIMMVLLLIISLSACSEKPSIIKTTFTESWNVSQKTIDIDSETANQIYKMFKAINLEQASDHYEGCFGTISFYLSDGTIEKLVIVNSDVISYNGKTYKIDDRMLYITLLGVLYGNADRSVLTIDNIKILVSTKGKELTYQDFKNYVQLDVGSGLLIMSYPIDNDYYLLLGTQGQDEVPMYIHLMTYNNDNYIDIREADIDEFINANK